MGQCLLAARLVSVPPGTAAGSLPSIPALGRQLCVCALPHTPLHWRVHIQRAPLFSPLPPCQILTEWPYNLLSEPEQLWENKGALLTIRARQYLLPCSPPPNKGCKLLEKHWLYVLKVVCFLHLLLIKIPVHANVSLHHTKKKYLWEAACYRMHRKVHSLMKWNSLEMFKKNPFICEDVKF